MDNKPKLQMNPSEKSPPPSKLLISHGKPNFTIIKSPKILSSPPAEHNIFSGADLKPSAIRKISPPKSTFKIDGGSTKPSETSDEFLRLHKKIGGRNYDDIENNNVDDFYPNGNEILTMIKDNSTVERHFATVQKNGIQTVESVCTETNGFSDKLHNHNDINGPLLTTPTPEKLILSDKTDSLRTSSSSLYSSRTPSPLPKSNSSVNQSMERITSPSGVNFEQRTIVSFSRDMSVPNRYPDTVKTTVTKGTPNGRIATLPREFADLKFEIASNGELIRPVVKKNVA